jgi:DNA-directed RNA polymerase subunit RPC12/RpoP
VSLAVRVSEKTKMTSTFLHEDKNVPPDEAVERDAPPCASCGQQMWLVRVDTKLSDGGTRTKREYECSHCGARQALQTASECISPLSA